VVHGSSGHLTGDITFAATAERVHGGLWLLRGEATAGSPGVGRGVRARSGATALVTALPLADFAADFYAPLISGGVTDLPAGTAIDATHPSAVPPSWNPADCAAVANANPPPVRAALALGSAASLNSAAVLAGTPPVLNGAPRADSADFQRLGPLLWSELALLADRTESGVLHLSPASRSGTCDTTAPANWGAPADPAHPCFDYFPLIHAPGPLIVSGGEGQGILAVDGQLTLEPGTRFTGVILARSLVADRAEIAGSVRVQSSARVSADLSYNDCAIQRALGRAPALRRLYRGPDRWWLPGFD
jgi:hypothetical protein